MQLISCHDGRLLTLNAARLGAGGQKFRTGLADLDALMPGGALTRGAVHEVLADPSAGKPLFFALLLARAAAQCGAVIWCDPKNEMYPPALALHGIPLERLFLLRSASAQQTWAVAECLRCKGVGAVVAAIDRLSRIEARRLQLAAEVGGAAGLLLRPTGKGSQIYAASTRWLVRPAPGEKNIQRWTVQLLHGHGGRLQQPLTLECRRENHSLRAIPQLADRSSAKTSRRILARAS